MSTDTLATNLSGERERLQRRARRCRVVFRVGTLLLILGSLAALMLLVSYGRDNILSTAICFALALVGGGVGVFAGALWYAAITQIAKSGDAHNIGYLLEAYATKEAVQPAIERALIATLPLLQTTDTHLLTGRQREQLCQMLKVNNAQLVAAILDALQKMGDTRALPTVERLAAGRWSASYNLPVRQAAAACLAALRERAEYEQHSKGLLRASDAPRASADVLLRPAADTPISPYELLRAANNTKDEP